MIHPAPTTKINPSTARGTVTRQIPATATRPAFTVLTFPNTSYELHLEAAIGDKAGTLNEGSKTLGTIRAEAQRIDIVRTGGRYVEPLAGRPRRVQGMVIAVEGDRLVVDAGVPFHVLPTDPRQKAGDFQVGDFVSFDVKRGATYEPA
ncbi:MAG: hypothetical protein KDA05_04525 [Phycisphaerales bacterium]|nr:hypothetical protein [Phycisphaerales bacterium]